MVFFGVFFYNYVIIVGLLIYEGPFEPRKVGYISKCISSMKKQRQFCSPPTCTHLTRDILAL